MISAIAKEKIFEELNAVLTLRTESSQNGDVNHAIYNCPSCGKDAYVYFGAGYFSWVKCNHENKCGYRKQIKDILGKEFLPPKENPYIGLFAKHGINLSSFAWLLGDIASPSIKISNEYSKHLIFSQEANKYKWKIPSGFKATMAEFYPVVHVNEKDILYVFAGEWDWMKGIEDGLACTSSLFGEGYMPKDQGFNVFTSYDDIRICYDVDTKGLESSSKLARKLKEKFQDKKIYMIKLPFSGENGNKDYCDYRLTNGLDKFLALEPIEIKAKKTKRDVSNESFEKEKTRAEESKKQFQNIIKTVIGMKGDVYDVTENGVFIERVIKSKYTNDSCIVYEKICDDDVVVKEWLTDIAAQESYIKLAWDGKEKIFPLTTLQNRNFEKLASAGIRILSPNTNEMGSYFLAALSDRGIVKEFSTRNGWFGNRIIVGNKVLSKEKIKDIARHPGSISFGSKGDESLWQQTIKRYTNDPQIQIFLAISALAPVACRLGVENCIFHLWQESGCGKTFTAKIASSYWGAYENDEEDGTGLLRSWNGTFVGLEYLFYQLKNMPAFLDESHLCKHQDMISQIVYAFGNGRGRDRGAKDKPGSMAEAMAWRTLAISTGEKKISDALNQGGIGSRVIEVFRKTVESISEIEFRETLDILKKNYGFGGIKFLEYYLQNDAGVLQMHKDILAWLEENQTVKKIICGEDGERNNIAKRLLPRWALIFLGAQLNRNLFGFEYSQQSIFEEMLESLKTIEEKPTVSLVGCMEEICLSNKANFQQKKPNSFTSIDKNESWGFYDETIDAYYIFPNIIKRELSKRGYSYSQLNLIKNRLICDSDGRIQKKARFDGFSSGQLTRFIVFTFGFGNNGNNGNRNGNNETLDL